MRLPDEGSGMKRDSEVLLMRRERAKGRTQEQAAARAGMSLLMELVLAWPKLSTIYP